MHAAALNGQLSVCSRMCNVHVQVIAQDEAGHAALAFRAVRWATRTDAQEWKRVDRAVSALSQSDAAGGPLSLRAAVDRGVVSWWKMDDLASDIAVEGRVERAVRVVSDRVMGKGASEVAELL